MIDSKERASQPDISLMMETEELAALGLNSVAYVRQGEEAVDPEVPGVVRNGYAIHAANGQRIGWAPSLDLAQIAIRQHDMVPMTVH
ncbi:DUF1150 family protein [Pararhodospirillum photometricum]|uniref:Uncharacterized protein n=1 Tax=Pararhodospirillum photometricum DSM 122 TaxID=1150469 RepID=H6SLQ8_PARPM|nr:DUF1150 family protein [Pararhodospirillum photometricum]CCG08923.1 Putative uncharacterized protein [Pararhodospirillum photometricum DSM 122]